MLKKVFLFSLSLLFLIGLFNASAQNIYTKSINKAKEVKNQVEEKTKEEIKTGAEEKTTPSTIQTENQNQNKEKTSEKKINKGEEHKSQVSLAVQELIRAADRFESGNPGVGKKVRIIAQEQNESVKKISDSIEKIEKRNKVVKFLIGSNYGEIKKVKEELKQNRLRVQELNKIANQLKNEGEKTILQEQIQVLESENTKLQDFIDQEEGRFSLFGWLVKLFQ